MQNDSKHPDAETTLIRCPVCEQKFDPNHSAAMPFCSERCRRIDLSRWLDERYTMPIERPEADEPGELPHLEGDAE